MFEFSRRRFLALTSSAAVAALSRRAHAAMGPAVSPGRKLQGSEMSPQHRFGRVDPAKSAMSMWPYCVRAAGTFPENWHPP